MSVHAVSVTRVIHAPVEAVWAVVNDTSRYAEWVDGVLELVSHHGPGTVGRTYTERNRTVGPLTTFSVWTVRRVQPPVLRVDTGVGFTPLKDLTSSFRLEDSGAAVTEMTYEASFRLGLGPLGAAFGKGLCRSLRAEFRRSMDRLDALLREA